MRVVRASVAHFLRARAATLTRLRRVNEALSAWDEYDATALLPQDVRPRIQPPPLNREALQDLQRVLVETVGELEAMWERRN